MDLASLTGAELPVLAAPMAGGPTTPALVRAAAGAGSFGLLAGGYKSVGAVAEEVGELGSAAVPFGVNLFAPNPVPVDPAAFRTYRDLLLPLAEQYRVDLPHTPSDDDDGWHEKVEAVAGVPLVTFTFGLPDSDSVRRLRRDGSVLGQTVTTAGEARAATDAGIDLLVVQAPAAGGHAGTFTPGRAPVDVALPDLVRAVRAESALPVIAGGGVAGPDDVRDVLAAGADAVAVGTLLLLADEAGTSPTYRAALRGPDRGDPVLTRAYSGRPARGLPTAFTRTFDGLAPLGYPALHHLTTPIRRAAAAAGDAENINLWAGTGYRNATSAPAADILRRLAGSI